MTDKLQDRRTKGWFWDSNEIFESGLSTIAIVVRLYLARCADEKGKCFPSASNIAKKCSISRASVFNALNELEHSGWIKRESRVVNNTQSSNVYYLLTPEEETSATSDDAIPSPSDRLVQEVDGGSLLGRRGGSTKKTGVVYQVDTEQDPINKTQLTIPKEEIYMSSCDDQPASENPPDDVKAPDPSQEVIDYFNETWADIFPRGFTLTDKRRRQILARLKVFSLSDIEKAIDNLHASAFHVGNNDRGWKATIDFLIKNDEQIDTWAKNPPMGGSGNGRSSEATAKQKSNKYAHLYE